MSGRNVSPLKVVEQFPWKTLFAAVCGEKAGRGGVGELSTETGSACIGVALSR